MSVLAAIASDPFLERVAAFTPAAALVAGFITAFTKQRDDTHRRQWAGDPDGGDVLRAALVTLGLLVATVAVLLAGVRLAVDAARDLHPFSTEPTAPLRSLLCVLWLLLGSVAAWQVYLLRGAFRLRRRIS